MNDVLHVDARGDSCGAAAPVPAWRRCPQNVGAAHARKGPRPFDPFRLSRALQNSAEFECADTNPSRRFAPQDEGVKGNRCVSLILRSPQRGRLEGRGGPKSGFARTFTKGTGFRDVWAIAQFAVGTLCALLAWTAFPAQAEEAIVIEASGTALSPGETVDGAKPLVLTVGQKVTLVTNDGRTIKLAGPFSAAPIPGAAAAEGSVAQSLKGVFAARSADTSSLGVVRGTADQVPVPAPWLVEIRHGGSRCIREGQPVVFWQDQPPPRAQAITVAPADHSWNARATWPAAVQSLEIPANVPLQDSRTYTVDLAGAAAPITIHVIPKVIRTDAARAAWMIELGCEAQAKVLIAGMN
jgi:hypothetical protein